MRSRRGAAVLLAVLTAACAQPAAEDALPPETTTTTTTVASSTTTTEAPTTTTTVALPPAVPVAWRACGGGFECGTVAVPVSYQDPMGPTLELALIRNPADVPSQRIGTLVMNPGGPGASGVRRVRRGFQVSPEVGDRFDIVGFDPRGVGDSTPVTCGGAVPGFRATDLAPDTPQEAATLEAAARAVADECLATEGERLAHLGTVAVAHDVEVIRRALGETQISYVGLSYGTLIGQLWADAHPSSVRALVLDGVVNPNSGGAMTSTEQADGVERVVHAMDEACGADPACPLASRGGLLSSYDELAGLLEAGQVRGHGVGPTQLAYAAFYATYDRSTWPVLWRAVADGLAGDLSGVAALAGSYTGLVPYAPFAIVTCLDGAHPRGYDEWQQAVERYTARSARFGAVLANELLPCAFWPEASYEPRPLAAEGTPPVLVVGSTGDAATPYDSAVDVSETLATGVLLTVELEGHVALGDSPCATERITRYLVDLAVPEPGARC